MRYFKYKNTNKNMNNALKERYLSLTKDEKSTVRKEKVLRRFSSIVAFIIFFSCMFVSFWFIVKIPAQINLWAETLVVIGKTLLFFALLIVCGILAYVITIPLWKKVGSFNLPMMKKEIFSKACGHLRDYYELKEPYIITKCYDSSDKRFMNHDVCIFIVNDELRITTDLVRGFLYGYRDLGCYVLERNEIELSKKSDDNLLIAELKAGETFFLLGYRAKRFIENSFLSRKNDT